MYTCCPICKTNFNVTEAQLQVAQGKVRCGSCKNVFNARQHIHYHPLKTKKSTETPTQHIKTDTTPSAVKETSYTPNNAPVSERYNKPITNHRPPEQTEEKKSKTSDIDAIFNALDSQLTSGNYIDIAKPAETDIREADFDDDFESSNSDTNEKKLDLNLFNTDNSEIQSTKHQVIEEQPVDSPISNEQYDSYESDIETDYKPESNVPTDDTDELSIDESSLTDTEKDDTQQHAFDFISLEDEPNISEEDEKDLAKVDKPLKATNTIDSKQKNAALHQAIDNIIKVDNNIATPYEEHEDDHFVIEMQSEPDVELVDENDIDKLFASTDSLRISDLKFDKFKSPDTDQSQVDIEDIREQDNQEQDSQENDVINPVLADEDLEAFNQQLEEQLNPDNFSTDFEKELDNYDADDFDSDYNDIETDFDEQDNIEEEIVLSSAPPEQSSIPHRLRDAVASTEKQGMNLRSKLLYMFLSLVMIILLLFQLVLFKSTSLANSIPALQPLLNSMCNQLPCRYTGNHNSKQIKIVNRDVRLHPKIKGALLISATIVNQAGYTQPYPTILLKFTDLTGSTVAQRYFLPKEYLGLLNKPFALMPSKKPVQLNIEILDPGSDAINFQFFFL